jgi:adhesin HecA-like repeat protein
VLSRGASSASSVDNTGGTLLAGEQDVKLAVAFGLQDQVL